MSALGAEGDSWSWRLTQNAIDVASSVAGPSGETIAATDDICWQPFTASARPRGHWHKRRRVRQFSSDDDAEEPGQDISTSSLAAKEVLSDKASVSQEDGQETKVPHEHKPLTLQETQRLLGLIKMLFRFKIPSSRRIAAEMQARDMTPSDEQTVSDIPLTVPHTLKAESTVNFHPYLQDIKTKYHKISTAKALDTQLAARRTRKTLARIHPRDASVSSQAALRLSALLPALFPTRFESSPTDMNWILELVLQATRDSNGNILLPDAAYTPTVSTAVSSSSQQIGHGDDSATIAEASVTEHAHTAEYSASQSDTGEEDTLDAVETAASLGMAARLSPIYSSLDADDTAKLPTFRHAAPPPSLLLNDAPKDFVSTQDTAIVPETNFAIEPATHSPHKSGPPSPAYDKAVSTGIAEEESQIPARVTPSQDLSVTRSSPVNTQSPDSIVAETLAAPALVQVSKSEFADEPGLPSVPLAHGPDAQQTAQLTPKSSMEKVTANVETPSCSVARSISPTPVLLPTNAMLNLSHLLAQKANADAQAQKLFLRTHPSLRKAVEKSAEASCIVPSAPESTPSSLE